MKEKRNFIINELSGEHIGSGGCREDVGLEAIISEACAAHFDDKVDSIGKIAICGMMLYRI